MGYAFLSLFRRGSCYFAKTQYSPGLSFFGSLLAFALKMLVMPSIDGTSPVNFTFCALPF